MSTRRWRVRLLLLAVGAAGVVTWMLREPGPGASARFAEPRPVPTQRARPPAPVPAAPLAPGRNVFEYAPAPSAERGPARPRTAAVEPKDSPPVPPPAGESGPRLVGIVQRGGRPRAVLSMDGELVVLGVGESALGYTVVALNEDTGVRLKREGGEEVTLRPPL